MIRTLEPPALSFALRGGLASRVVLFAIRIYWWTLSPLMGNVCRFHPSCSRYTATCVERFGALRGGWLGAKRICRCHPFNAGGFDPPPELERGVAAGLERDETAHEETGRGR